jgi:integrase
MEGQELATTGTAALERVGQAANDAAAQGVFTDYRTRKAANTLSSQAASLAMFSEFLGTVGVEAVGLAMDPASWKGITWGLVEGFRNAMVRQGYAVATVNARLSAVKTYAKLAAKAGILDRQELAMIAMVDGYGRKDAVRLDGHRTETGIPTRLGCKKPTATPLSAQQAEQLKDQPDTPQGRRDAVMVALLLDLGLRVGELAALTVDAVDLGAAEITFYRPKVDKRQTHTLAINGLLATVKAYMESDAPSEGPLLRSSVNGGELDKPGMSERAITSRVRTLGERLGVKGLSAHDLRHSWATRAAQHDTPAHCLTEAGGWTSYATAQRYIASARIANAGVRFE